MLSAHTRRQNGAAGEQAPTGSTGSGVADPMPTNDRGQDKPDDGIASRTTGAALAGWDGVQDPAEPVRVYRQDGAAVLQSEQNGRAWIESELTVAVEDAR